MLIKDWYTNAIRILCTKRIHNLDITLIHLLSYITGCSGGEIRLSLNDAKNIELSEEQVKTLNAAVSELNKGKALSKILHSSFFCGYEFYVNENVLCPRQVTQALVERGLEYIKSIQGNVDYLNILDLGTGSGCIAISIYKILVENEGISDEKINVYAIDKSQKALEIARYNACKLNAEINFMQSNWFQQFDMAFDMDNMYGKFDLIISNPPYLSNKDYIHKTAKHDPYIALFADENGFADYKIILKNAQKYLKTGGILALEIPNKLVNNLQKYKKYYSEITIYRGVINISIALLKYQ